MGNVAVKFEPHPILGCENVGQLLKVLQDNYELTAPLSMTARLAILGYLKSANIKEKTNGSKKH
ncbi:hypothetical protein EBR96_03650 [bacterium]|nr:hypothetical protein [bacterium]